MNHFDIFLELVQILVVLSYDVAYSDKKVRCVLDINTEYLQYHFQDSFLILAEDILLINNGLSLLKDSSIVVLLYKLINYWMCIWNKKFINGDVWLGLEALFVDLE